LVTEDKRRFQRISIDTDVWIGQDGIFTRTRERLKNLSVAGAFIETAETFSVGSVLSLRFQLSPGDGFITCTAIVRNVVVGRGVGIEFLDLSRLHRMHVTQSIEKSQVQSGDDSVPR